MPFLEVKLSAADLALLGTENKEETEAALAGLAGEALTELAGLVLDVDEAAMRKLAREGDADGGA